MAGRHAPGPGYGGTALSYLLDTHALLWARAAPDLLSPEALAVFEDRDSALYVSVASLWECAIKCSIGKLTLPAEFHRVVATDYDILGIETAHLEAYGQLPMLHRDPFDRLLVAQAQVADLIVLTRDGNIAKYDVAVLAA